MSPPSLLESTDESRLRAAYRDSLAARRPLEPHLRAVVDDVLDHPGSLVRARLAYALGVGLSRRHGAVPLADEAWRSLAVAIEYFHTASLLFDDLPAMDDARERRGRPCPHRVWGEAATVLAALALVNRAHVLIWGVQARLPVERAATIADLVDDCLGVAGILDGQARDLHYAELHHADLHHPDLHCADLHDATDSAVRVSPIPGGRVEEVLAVAEGKTVTLIRLTLLLPAIAAGADAATVRRLGHLARAWGLAYQILDDFKDAVGSPRETGKTAHRDAALGRPNLPAAEGPERAWERLEALLGEARDLLAELDEGCDVAPLHLVQARLERDRAALDGRFREAA